MSKPFWEKTYKDMGVSTFSNGPTKDVKEYHGLFKTSSQILDVGCGEGRNSIFLAGIGHIADAFDISQAGIEKARYKAKAARVSVNFSVCDINEFKFDKQYDVVLSHGVLHLPPKSIRNEFIRLAQENTVVGGYHIIGIFTNKRPAAPGLEEFTQSLFDVGELPDKYIGWHIISHDEGMFRDQHPTGERHEHAYERIVARKL